MPDPAPFNEFVVKVATRCNLSCAYCYEYNLGDDSWRRSPRFLSPELALLLAARISDHAVAHRQEEVFVAFHGGEPMLLGPGRLDELARAFKSIQETGVRVRLSMQTNATLVDASMLEVLRRHEVHVGVSIDGPGDVNDMHRRDHGDNGSFDAAWRGLVRLREELGDLFSGVLAVVDVTSDPLRVFDFFGATGIRQVDFLLPHHHWDRPPPRPNADPRAWGHWYAAIWGAWIAGRHPHMRIRFLENIVRRLVGAEGLFEEMNLAPARLLTINSDGAIEGVDTLKSVGGAVHRLGANIRSHAFDELLTHPAVRARQTGVDALSEACQRCAIVDVCAGGYMPHRFGRGRGFDNPSVYCEDLFFIVERIRRDLRANAARGANA